MAKNGSAWSKFAAPSLKLLSEPPPPIAPSHGTTPAPQSLATPPLVSFLPLEHVMMCPAKAGSGEGGEPRTDHTKPCDVESLTIAITPPPSHIWSQFMGMGWLGKLLTEETQAVPPPVILAPLSGGPTAPGPACGPLAIRSIRLEFVASPPPSGNQTAKGAKLDLSAKPGPGYCGEKGHALLEISPRPVEVHEGPVIGAPELGGTLVREGFASGQFMLYADKVVSDGFFGSFAAPFQFAWALWDRGDLGKSYSVSLGTCGNRNGPAAVGSLSADIVVYPEALLTIEVTIPEVVEFYERSKSKTRERAWRKESDGSLVSTQSVKTKSTNINRTTFAGRDADGIRHTGSINKTESTTGSVTKSDGSETTFTAASIVKATEANLRFEDGSNEYFSRTSKAATYEFQGNRVGPVTVEGVEYGDALELDDEHAGFAEQLHLVVKCNNVIIGGDYKTWRERILIAKVLIEDLPRLADRLNAKVQIGWALKGTIKGPSGSFKLVWGLKSSSARMRVEKYHGFVAEAVILKAEAEASFGLKLAFRESIDKVGKKTSAEMFDARVIGSLSGTVSLTGESEQLANVSKYGTVQLQGDITLKLEGKLHMLKAFYVDASVTGGLLVTGGFAATLDEPPTLGITAGFKKVVGTATVTLAGYQFSPSEPKVLIPESEPFFEIDFLKP